MKQLLPNYQYLQLNDTTSPNLVLLSRQVDGLREVLRRMKASEDNSVNHFISQKLQESKRAA
jgi:hypothetical protein